MTPSCVALGRVIICDLNFKRTENHNFTITTNTSQHVEFFHSLNFSILCCALLAVQRTTKEKFHVVFKEMNRLHLHFIFFRLSDGVLY